MDQVRQAAIKALIYGDIFNYPLTAEEMWEYAIATEPFSQEKLSSVLRWLKEKNFSNNIFYFLSGKESLITTRQVRQQASEKKIEKAKRVSRILSYIPTICFIGISGSVAMKNASEQDDIDLFFVTKKHTLWITRFLVSVVLLVLGVRRKKHAQTVTNTVCANMFLSRDAYAFPKEQQNIYIAHEIAQIIPLYSLKHTYDDLINHNKWIYTFLPNWRKKHISVSHQSLIGGMIAVVLSWGEPLVRWMQLTYMRKSRTTETVTNTVIAFHPNNRQDSVLASFIKKCNIYDL